MCQSDHTIITKINSDGTYNITGKNNVTLSKIKQKVTHVLPLLFFIDKGVHEIEMFFQEILSKCNESKSPKVQSAGCMCLGRLAAVTEFSVNPSHVQQAFQILAGILGDKSSNQSVGARAS